MLFGIKHDPEHSNFSTFQALGAINHRQRLPHESSSIANTQPIFKFTTEKNGYFPILTQSASADTENLLRHRNDAEGAEGSWAPHAPTPFSSSFFAHALGWLMRVAQLYFLITAAQCGSRSQPDAVQSQSRGVGCSAMRLFFCIMAR